MEYKITSTTDIEEIKRILKSEILLKGFKNVSDFAKYFVKKHDYKFSLGTIKINLSANQTASIPVLNEIANEFGLEIERKVVYNIQTKGMKRFKIEAMYQQFIEKYDEKLKNDFDFFNYDLSFELSKFFSSELEKEDIDDIHSMIEEEYFQYHEG